MSSATMEAKVGEEKDEFDSSSESESETSMALPKSSSSKLSSTKEDEDEDSDFEDPDELEVPGGGRSLKSIQASDLIPNKSSSASKSSSLLTVGNGKTTITPVSSAKSVLKKGAVSPSSVSIQPSLPRQTLEEDGLEVVRVIKANSHSFPRPNKMFGTKKNLNGNSNVNSSLLGPANPFVPASNLVRLGNAYNRSSLVQKSFQGNGRFPRPSSPFNPATYSALLANMGQQRAMSQLHALNAAKSNLYNSNTKSSNSGLLSSTNQQLIQSASFKSSQISNLWLSSGSGGYKRHAQQLMSNEEDEEAAAEDEEDMGVIETYSNYMPAKLKIGLPHPDPVVETASLASVEPPDVWYDLSLPLELIEEGKLSALQLETVTYASQQHSKFLPNGNRAGFLIGDGAGVGKGRTIAGIIMENYLKGRKKAIWVSVSNDLKYDSERDLRDIGAGNIDVNFLSKMKYAKINSNVNNNVKKGVMYSTYSALIGESQSSSKYKSRLKQLLQWCGEDFDGVIVFDECHRAKNLCPSSSSSKPTKTGQCVLELQQRLPKARIVYASATGASEPKHMAYMVRLGIWGEGSPFKNFTEFLNAVEKRGVGAMEIVAMDMKLRGMYIARQLSFSGVSFRIDEVELSSDIREAYNSSVDFWVDLLHKFEEAAELINADKKMKKVMWGQFWSSHQRFFKYLCIASKVKHVVKVASEVIKMGKCVVIGLQSTGEARTMEVLEREEELTDFVSTAKGVLQSLVEKHFPAPDRSRVNKILAGIMPKKSLLDELGIKVEPPTKSSSPSSNVKMEDSSFSSAGDAKRKGRNKRLKLEDLDDAFDSNSDKGSDFEADDDDELDDEEEDDNEDINDEEGSSDFNPFGSGTDDEDDPWARSEKRKRGRKRKAGKKKKMKKKSSNGTSTTTTPTAPPSFSHLFPKSKTEVELESASNSNFTSYLSNPNSNLISNLSNANSNSSMSTMSALSSTPRPPPPQANIDKAVEMKNNLLDRIEKLGLKLPANTLDQLIDELGGPENVAEMTGRKGRIVQDEKGDVKYELRSEIDVPLETLNLTEKERFMRGSKDVAIISEAASSGISLQADRRVANRKRRVHMTLELPWSADRAIQQFGRTHRSNQVSAPEYILLISDLAGEHRFASIVAKRLESLGALTHGDRRAGESRDLSRFNIDNKYGRAALESTFRAIMGYETPIVQPPTDYEGDFFKDVADGLVGVGIITQNEDNPGVLSLDKNYNDMAKFLNRILGLKVELQNRLFAYFSDTLNAIINQAKRSGRYDQGILDVGVTTEDEVELVRTHTFVRKHATGSAKILLHVLTVERGLSWDAALDKWSELTGNDEGFYLSHQVRNNKKTAILAVQLGLSDAGLKAKKRSEKHFVVYRPNTGQQVRQESLIELRKKYKKVTKEEAKEAWVQQFESSAKRCSHAYWKGKCKSSTLGLVCEVGLRRKNYNVLTGSVLSVWSQVEDVLTHDGNKRGTSSKMQVVRLKLGDGKRIVGTLIPNSAMSALLKALEASSEESEETIY